MEIRSAVSRHECERMNTRELRAAFLLEKLFTPGQLDLVYWETDRTIIGSAVPTGAPILLEASGIAAEFFCQRREACVMNLGGEGNVRVDGATYLAGALACLYVGRGAREVIFSSEDSTRPAKFYIISYPAHADRPTSGASPEQANQLQLGLPETANKRLLHQYVHGGGIASCQLMLGFTRLAAGNVWNTMPPHTHLRRSEVYLYFEVADHAAVFHFMGAGDETRHLVVHNLQAVLSPPWSVHSGCGTRDYSFIWAMGGENQDFNDMDGIPVRELR